jgi:translation elongation factor EF-1alpha
MRRIKFFVCGQVDCGKSTLIGNLLYLSGAVKKLDNKSSIATKYSDLLDSDESERERGITQCSSNNIFIYNEIEYEAIDTPGHLLYIRELINAISLNKGSIGCIIISAVKSEFDSMFKNGTTKEDIILMRCCGVNNLICLINKIDKQQTNIDYVKDEFSKWILTKGFKRISFCCISAYQGINLLTRINSDEMCFIETLQKVDSNIKRTINEKNVKKNDKCKLDFYSFDFNKIISIGYKSVYHIVEHMDKTEIEGEIVHIKTKEEKVERFFRSNQNLYLYIKWDEIIEFFEGQRLILREDNRTIGFGYVVFN